MTSIQGLDTLRKQLKGLDALIEKETAKALYLGGLKIEEHAKRAITQDAKTGRTYKRGKVTRQASAPGEAPANQTGRLVNSINTEAAENGQVVRISAGGGVVDYAAHLEFGTKDMAERPFFRPALEASKPFIQDKLTDGVKKAIETASRTR